MREKTLVFIRVARAAPIGPEKYFIKVRSDALRQQLSLASFDAGDCISDPHRITVLPTCARAL